MEFGLNFQYWNWSHPKNWEGHWLMNTSQWILGSCMSIHQSNCSHSLKIKYHLRMLDLSNNTRELMHSCPRVQTFHSPDSAFITNSTLFRKLALQYSYKHPYENVTCPCSTHGNVLWNVFSLGWLKKLG